MHALRGRRHRAALAALVGIAAGAAATLHTAAADPSAADGSTPAAALTRGHPPGIWKAAVPPRPMDGAYDDYDPLGLIAGARIKADCSLNWRSPDDGRLVCFSSGTSLEVFLEDPQVYLERADHAWRSMGAARR
jgi:hypothetical protein